MFAGVAIAAIEIPTAIAYAELAGFPPVVGLYASILPLIAFAMLSSSPQLIVGPDAAICMMVAAALAPGAAGDDLRYLDLSITLSLMVGVFCVVAGILRLGAIANFLSRPILVGFLNGIALTIISSQLGKLCGIAVRTDSGFFLRMGDFASKLGGTHFPTLLVGIVSLLLMLLAGRFAPRVPGALVGVFGGAAIMAILKLANWDVPTLGTVPAGLPWPHFPTHLLTDTSQLLLDAGSIALVCFCSSMLTAKTFAVRNGYELDANRELIALGVANFASALSKGFVIAGADSRTAINDQAGGRTQLSGIVAAIIMALFLAVGTRPLEYIPTASLGAILVLAGASLFDFKTVRSVYNISRWEFVLSAIATLGVATVGVLPGIALAVLLSILLLLVRASSPYDAILGQVPGLDGFMDMSELSEARAVPGILIYRFDASLLFFNSDYFKRRVRQTVVRSEPMPRHFIFDMEAINAIDVTGVEGLEEVRSELAFKGIDFLVARVKREVSDRLVRAGLSERIGADNFYPSVRSAVQSCLIKDNPSDHPGTI
jgi:high affinity sulfate transporter 1